LGQNEDIQNKNMGNADRQQKTVLVKGKQFLLLIRHPSCYS